MIAAPPAADAPAIAARAVNALYREADVPPPSEALPVAPLGPLLDRLLRVSAAEIPGLTARAAESYLLRRRAVDQPFDLPSEDAVVPLAGFLYASGAGAFFFVEARNPVVRRRFSVAHELGHFVLHFRPELARWRQGLEAGEEIAGGLFDAFSTGDAETADGEGASREAFDRREAEADAFAATLLMPEDVVRARAAALRAQTPALPPGGLSDRLAMDLLVSRQAMERRLRALGMVPPPATAKEARGHGE